MLAFLYRRPTLAYQVDVYKRQVWSVAVPDAVMAVSEIVWKEEPETVSVPALAATPAAASATLTFASVRVSVPVAATAVPETVRIVTVSSHVPPPERTMLPAPPVPSSVMFFRVTVPVPVFVTVSYTHLDVYKRQP